jgi:RNA polymerase sigma-70 factor (ECF subfamily)
VTTPGTPLVSILEPERKYLWGICYRMTGSGSDADDLVQETFVRALGHPELDTTEGIRPWLVRVAMNLARDELRRRKRHPYPGFWLPTPIETEGPDSPLELASTDDSPEARYGLVESASFAFLVAVEALSTTQRAVLILRDVFDYSSRETGEILGLSEENVRITLHRARKAMAGYDGEHQRIDAAARERMESALFQIASCLATGNLDLARPLIGPETRSIGDGGGKIHAAPAPVRGGEKVLKMYIKLATRASPDVKVALREINGVPAIVTEDPAPKRPNGPRVVLLLDLGPDGKIRTLYSVTAPDKLGKIRWGLG